MEKHMEGFSRWWAKECDEGKEIYPSSYDDCSDAWRAAIKWALEGFESGIYPPINKSTRE